jgi:hypothetical protein
MEALQMVKFSLKQKWLDFMQGWAMLENDMWGTVDDQPDLLADFSTGVQGSFDGIMVAVC